MRARGRTARSRIARIAIVALAATMLFAALPQDASGYLSTGTGGDRSWYWQNPAPQGNQLLDTSFIDSQRGWAVGLAGTTLKTDSGGQVWEALDLGAGTLSARGVDFVDANTGWVVGGDLTTNGFVRKTTDGGATWVQQASGSTQIHRGVKFLDANTGWLVASAGVIRRTTNGGASWQTGTSGTTQQLNAVDFASSSVGWAVGNAGTILKTTNGGANWSQQAAGLTTQALYSVDVVDANNAWAVGASGTLLRTTDGGTNWSIVSLGVTTALYDIEFGTSQNGWITGATGFIRATADGGASWVNQNSGTLAIRAAAPVSASDVVAVGDVGTILRTTNGGMSWLSEDEGTTRTLYGMDFSSASHGVVVGAVGTILRTDDAGASWLTLSSGANDLRAVDLVDGSTGYAVGALGTILKTTNGGTSWSPQVSGTTQLLYGVSFANASVGWAVGAAGTILSTTDGGVTWTPQASNTASILYGVRALDANNVWAVGASGVIRRTTDGGATTWTTANITTANGGGTALTSAIYAIEVIDAQTQYVVSTTGRIRKTVNGGALWTVQTAPNTQTLYGVDFSDADNGWAVGAAGSIHRTSNGGVNWTAQNSAATAIIYGVVAGTSATGWAVGASGVVRRTTNSGATWTSLTYGTVATMYNLAFADTDTGWVVGAGGLLRRTRDGGITWRTLTSGTTAALNDVSFAGSDVGWVVGASGVVRKSTNAGDTWVAQTSGTTLALNGVDFANASTGWAVGNTGTIIATVDGGSTWTTQTAGTTEILRAVDFVDSSTGWAVGNAGAILKTVNGGSTWVPQTSGTGQILYGVTFADASTGWAVGAAGTILKTSNGGSTWSPQTSGTTQVLYGVFSRGSSYAWAVGAAGTVRRTVNGGSTAWTGQSSGTTNILYGVGFADQDNGWIVGATGTTLRTTSATPPTTIATLDPSAPDGLEDWYVTPPAITLQKDKPGITRYSWVSGTGPWSTYVDPVIALEGARTFYYYSIDSALNEEAVKSFPLKVDSIPPSAPATLSASVEGTSVISLSWGTSTDAVSGLSYYEVFVDGSSVATTTATTQTVAPLAPNTEYLFYVTAVDVAGNVGDPSPAVLASTDPIDTSPVTTMASVVPATPDGQNSWWVTPPSITLSANLPAIINYSWDTSSGPWSTYSAPLTAAEGTPTLYYWSRDPYGYRFDEAVKSASFSVDTIAPNAPSGLAAVAEGSRAARVSWNPVTDTASGIDRYEVFVDGAPRASTDETSVLIPNLPEGVTYFVSVRAHDRAGHSSALSAEVSVQTSAPPTPGAPSLVVAYAPNGSTVYVNWRLVTDFIGEVTYNVYRSEGGPFQAIGSVAGVGESSYIDETVGTSRRYWYAVSVTDSRGEGSLSDTSTAEGAYHRVITSTPKAPRGVQSQVATDGAVQISWTQATLPNLAGYLVLRSMSSGGQVETLTPAPIVANSYVDTSTMSYRRYWYSLVSVDTSGVLGARSLETFARSRVATTLPTPHASFGGPVGNRCGLCHVTHSAETTENLLTVAGPTERPLCLTCHDGTSGPAVALDLQLDAEGTSHGLGKNGAAGELTCSSCHAAHVSAEATQTLRLLDVDGVTQGNAACYGCHGTDSTLPGGDMTVFEASGHNTAVSAPAGGSGVVCLQCHESHGSPNDYLMTYSGADSCLTCHRASGPFTGAKNIRELLTLSSSSEAHHDLSAADQAANGSFITCQNCHNTHTASAAFPLVDPDDPSPSGIWTGGANTVKETCFRCHDGQLPTAAQTLPWVKPPLGPGGTTQTADIQTAYATNPHGFGTGASFSLRPEMGYFNGDVLECDSCHEPHGAANNHNLRGDVSSADGVTTRRGLIVYDTPSGGNDVRFFCVSCHDTTQLDATRHPGGDIWSSFPVDCTTSCHKHVNGGL